MSMSHSRLIDISHVAHVACCSKRAQPSEGQRQKAEPSVPGVLGVSGVRPRAPGFLISAGRSGHLLQINRTKAALNKPPYKTPFFTENCAGAGLMNKTIREASDLSQLIPKVLTLFITENNKMRPQRC
jgi:hypothetical protein